MTKEQEVLKDLKEVTLEELDEAIKAVDKQEQEETIEYFEEQIKFIEATDCDYYDEELELYQNRVKQFNTVLSMLKEKDKQIEQYQNMLATNDMLHVIECENKDKIIDLMANEIANNITNTCPLEDYNYDLNCENKCNDNYKECWKQYFENKAKELLNK